MRYLLVISLVVLNAACGKAPVVNVPAEVRPYYDEFFQVVSHDESDGTISFLDEMPSNGEYGLCASHVGNEKGWHIYLWKRFWDSMQDSDPIDVINKKMVLFHELTHCVYSSTAHSSDPASYMNARVAYPAPTNLDQQVLDYTKSL